MVAQIALMILHFNNTPEDTEYKQKFGIKLLMDIILNAFLYFTHLNCHIPDLIMIYFLSDFLIISDLISWEQMKTKIQSSLKHDQ